MGDCRYLAFKHSQVFVCLWSPLLQAKLIRAGTWASAGTKGEGGKSPMPLVGAEGVSPARQGGEPGGSALFFSSINHRSLWPVPHASHNSG